MAERAAERYVLLLESAYDNGKLCSFSHRAFRLWANSLSYARKHRTDGRLSPNQAAVLLRLYGLTGKDVDELVDKGGWDRVEDGYVIHDFLDVNVSEDQISNLSATRATAGRAGGIRSGAVRRGEAIDDVTSPPTTGDLKGWARNQANSALRRGLLAKQDCEQCGAETVEMHHDDYRRPLDVRWLCPSCHKRVHSALRAEASASANASKHLGGASKPNEADIYIEEEGDAERDPENTHLAHDVARAPDERLLRVRAMARPDPSIEPVAPQAALMRALAASLNCDEPSTKSERRVWSEAISEMLHADPPVTQAEVPRLVSRWSVLFSVPCTPKGIAGNLTRLRSDEVPRPALNGHAARPQRESPMEQAARRIAAQRDREAS